MMGEMYVYVAPFPDLIIFFPFVNTVFNIILIILYVNLQI